MTDDRNSYLRRKIRKLALARWRPGDPCARCGLPMWDKRYIDLGHLIPFVNGGRFGDGVQLEHRHCSRSAGATLGNRRRGQPGPVAWPTSRRW
jgi:hypothetical protein